MSGMRLATFGVGADCWGGSTFTCNRSLPYSTTLNRNNPCLDNSIKIKKIIVF
jgi:hypothetical protein